MVSSYTSVMLYFTNFRLSSRLILTLCRSLTFLSLTACSPQFDWRTSHASTHHDTYRLEYPGKPLAAQRIVVLAGHSVQLTLQGVQTEGAQFAFGHVPANSPEQAKLFAQALAESFVANLNKNASQTTPVTFKPTKVNLAMGAIDYQIEANSKNTRYAHARFIWTKNAAYELLTVGEASALPPEAAEQFIRSMQFEP